MVTRNMNQLDEKQVEATGECELAAAKQNSLKRRINKVPLGKTSICEDTDLSKEKKPKT